MTNEIEQRKAQYESSTLKQLMDAAEKEICPTCFCCELVRDSEVCWSCGGFGCSECKGEGEIRSKQCIGRCDENGNHERKGSKP